MSYPYPKYNDDANVEAHVHVFFTTWKANHVSQRVLEVDADKSKIAEFRWSLEGKWTNCYSQHEEGEFESFKTLNTKFIRLFHRQVPQWELISQFYAISQEAHAIVPQFIIRFQNLRRQLARQPLEDDVKETFDFLVGIKRATSDNLSGVRLQKKSLEQVIDKTLLMDETQTGNCVSMMSL